MRARRVAPVRPLVPGRRAEGPDRRVHLPQGPQGQDLRPRSRRGTCRHRGGMSTRPLGYPRDLEHDVHLADGRTVRFRPIRPTDAVPLRAAIVAADAETIHLRFLGGRPPTTPSLLRHLTEVDYRLRLALVAVDEAGAGVAIARYEGRADSDEAEVAVVVDPLWRHTGIGTALLRQLRGAALDRGITHFRAVYFFENDDVASMLAALGGTVHLGRLDHGVMDEVVDLVPLRRVDEVRTNDSGHLAGAGVGWSGERP